MTESQALKNGIMVGNVMLARAIEIQVKAIVETINQYRPMAMTAVGKRSIDRFEGEAKDLMRAAGLVSHIMEIDERNNS